MKIRGSLKFIISLLLIGLIVSGYYFLVYIPQHQFIQKQQYQILQAESNTLAFIVDQELMRQLQAAKSMSSRTMIRNQLNDYIKGKISLEELQLFSQHKYEDGVKAIGHVLYAARVSKQKVIASYGFDEGNLIRSTIPQEPINEIQLSLLSVSPDRSILVSPILFEDTIIGYDLMVFDLLPLFQKVQSNGFAKLEFNLSQQKTLHTFIENKQRNTVEMQRVSSLAPVYFTLAFNKDSVFAPLNSYQVSQIWVHILLFVVLALGVFVFFHYKNLAFFQRESILKKRISRATHALELKVEELRIQHIETENLLKEFQFLTENTTDGIVMIKGGVIDYVSPSFKRSIFKAASMQNKMAFDALREITHPDDLASIQHRIVEASNNKQSYSMFRLRLLDATKSYRWFSVAMDILMDKAHNVEKTIVHIRDISEHVEKEKIISEQLVRLKSMNKEKDELFKLISHDLRSPLNAISGYLQVLKLSHRFSPDEFDSHMSLLETATNQASVMLNDMLDWFMMKGGSEHMQCSKQLVYPIIEQAVEDVSLQRDSKQIRILNQVNESLQLDVNKLAFESIFRNVLGNAIKFSPTQSDICIKTEVDGANIHFLISDNGIGLDASILKVINTTDGAIYSKEGVSGEKGAGIGIRLSQELAESMHGKLRARRNSGRGSTFILSLPLSTPKKARIRKTRKRPTL